MLARKASWYMWHGNEALCTPPKLQNYITTLAPLTEVVPCTS
jgi:hypothetical protein